MDTEKGPREPQRPCQRGQGADSQKRLLNYIFGSQSLPIYRHKILSKVECWLKLFPIITRIKMIHLNLSSGHLLSQTVASDC